MKPGGQAWQRQWQDKVRQEINFLPKRLVFITLLLLVLYGALVIRTELFLRTGYTGFVEARLRSKLTADYQSTEATALVFAPLSLALIEAKIRDENPHLSEQAVAPLVQTVMAAAYATIITATPTPGPVAYAVVQSVSLVTESIPTAKVASATALLGTANRAPVIATADDARLAMVFATPVSATVVANSSQDGDVNLTPDSEPMATRNIAPPLAIPSVASGLQQATPAFDAGASAIQPSPTGTPRQSDATPLMPTGMPEIPHRVATQVTAAPGVTATTPATTLPTGVTTATNEPSIQVALSQPAPTETPTAGASTGSSAALAATSTIWPLVTSTPQPTTTPSPVPTTTALAGNTPSPTFIEPTVTNTPVVTLTPAPMTATATVTKTNTPLPPPSPTASLTPTPTDTASPTVTPTATPTIGVPPAIVNLSASMENNKVYLNWSPSVAAGVVGYKLYRSHTSTVGSAVLVNAQLLAGSSYVDTVTLDGSQYFYVVTAVNQFNQESLPSQAVTITTDDRTPPDTPINFSLRLTGNTVQLQWQASSAPDLAGYNIYRSNHLPVDRTQAPLNGATLLPAPSYQDQIALNGETYYYVFTAVDFSGNESLPSIEAQIPTVDLEAPAPTGLTATFKDNAALLQWQANAESDVVGYRLYRERTAPVAESQPIHSELLLTDLKMSPQSSVRSP